MRHLALTLVLPGPSRCLLPGSTGAKKDAAMTATAVNQIALFDNAAASAARLPAAPHAERVHPHLHLDLHPQADAGFDAIGFEIGWDYARQRLVPPAEHLLGGHPVRQGWQAGRAAFGLRTGRPTRHVQRWLQLRLDSWLRARVFEDVMVTPRFLAQIDVPRCPVTRELLSAGEDSASDAVVLALFDGAAVAAGNLAIVSRRAAAARGACSAADAWAVARRIEAGEIGVGGVRGVGGAPAALDAAQWRRLATLISLATPTPHAQCASLPLPVLPPNRARLVNPVQGLQALLTLLFTGSAYARRMAEIGALMPDADSRRHYFLFMNVMLARRLGVGWQAERDAVRSTLEDAWAHPIVQRRWEQLALRLKRADCERVLRLATQRGLAGGGMRWLSEAQASDGWALESQGRVRPAGAPAARQRGSVAATTKAPTTTASTTASRPVATTAASTAALTA